MKPLALFLLASCGWALYADQAAEQSRNVAQLANAQTARYDFYRANNCSGWVRATNWGHSISVGETCNVAINDGYRRNLTPILADAGYLIKWVGVQHESATTVLECPATNLPGPAPTVQMVYDDLVENLADEMPDPSTTDWVFIGPTLTNSVTQGVSEAQMQATLTACITFTASVKPNALILLSNDIPRSDGYDLTGALQAANYAYTWTKAQGVNVKFLDINSCSIALCGDNLHPTYDGQNDFGTCMANLLLAALAE